MDLFHSITQGIDSVLTCHWFEQVKSFKMSDQLMDTEPGGESTQYVLTRSEKSSVTDINTRYESIKTQTQPTATQSGQLGGT